MRMAIVFSLLGAAALAEEPDQSLERDIEETIEIIVTGRRLDPLPVVPLSSIGSRDVFGPERIRETGARDLNELVQHIPALSTRPYNGGEASAPSFSMRGLPDDGLTEYVHILIDGVPASSLPYGWTAFSFMPVTPDRLFAVDYIRGGHSVRYSPNTVGGILNFITRPIPSRMTVESRTTIGDLGFLSQLISVGGRHGDLGLIATHVHRRGDGYRDEGGFRQQDSNVKLRWELGEDRWVATSISYMEDGHQAPGGLTQVQFDADRFANARPRNRFDGHRFVFDLVYHQESGEQDWWEGFAYVSKTRRHLRAQRPHFGTPATITDWQDNSYFFAVGGRIQRRIGGHTLYGGFRFHREWIPSWVLRSEPFAGGPATLTQDATFDLNTVSFHVDDTFSPLENLKIVAGFRVEWVPTARGSDPVMPFSFHDEFFTVLPGVGASYTLGEHAAIFANYYRGFRAPQVWGFSSATGSNSLKFEKGNSLEVGARARDLDGWSSALTLWRTEYDDFGVFFTGAYENLGRIVAYGLDFETEWQLPWMRGLAVIASVTFQNSELRSGPNRGNQTPYAWHQKAAWRLQYERDGWKAGIGGTLVGDSFSDDANTFAPSADGTLGINRARVVWDAQISKRVRLGEQGRLDLSIGATNLFDNDWFVHSRGGFFGGGLVAAAPFQAYASFQIVVNW